MVFASEGVELDHLPAVTDVTFARNQIAPLAVQINESEVNKTVDDQHPHHCEVPVPGAAEPTAKGEPGRNWFVLEGIAAEDLALTCERWIGVEDAKPAADHDDDGNEIHPVSDAYDPVVAFFAQ